MTVQQQLLIEQRVANEAKSPLIAYLLLFVLWGFGVHRMYLGRWGTGLAMLVLSGLGWLTAPIVIGWLPLAFVWLWNVVDIFLIPAMVAGDKAELRYALTRAMNRG